MNTVMRYLFKRTLSWAEVLAMIIVATSVGIAPWYVSLAVLILLSFGVTFLERKYDRPV